MNWSKEPPICWLQKIVWAECQSVKKALGPNIHNFRLLRVLLDWHQDRITPLVTQAIRLQYHPKQWRTAKGVLLEKSNKRDRTLIKSYQDISLFRSTFRGRFIWRVFRITLGRMIRNIMKVTWKRSVRRPLKVSGFRSTAMSSVRRSTTKIASEIKSLQKFQWLSESQFR